MNTAYAAESWLKVYGTALIGQGKKAEAIEPLRLYLDHFPVDDEARGRLVCALMHNGQNKEAESVVSALPNDSELRNSTLNEIAHDFDFSDSSEKRVLNGHSGWITSLEASPYNDELVSAGRDRNLIVWDSVSGDKLKVVNVIGEAPGRVQLSPEGNLALLVGTGASSPLKILDLNSGKYLQTPAGQETSLSAFKFTPDGKNIVTVHQNGSIRLWDRSFKSPQITKIQAHKQAEIFFRDGKIGVVFSGLDKLLKVVFPITAPPTMFEKFHQELITILRSDHVGSRFLTCGRDKTSAVWEMTSPLPTAILNNLNEIPIEAVLNPRLPLVALWDPKTGIKLWDYKAGSIIRQFDPETEVQSMTFSRDGDYLWIGGKDMALQSRPVYGKPISPTMMLAKIRPVTKQMKSDRQYNSMLEEAKRELKSGNYNIAYAMLRESQKLTGYERSDSTLDVIYLLKEHGDRVGLREGWKKSAIVGQSGILDVQFSPSAIYFLSAHADHMVRLWSTKAGKCIRTLEGHSNVVSSVKISANGREAISGSDDKSVRIWDLNTGRNTNTLKGHSMSVGTVLYSPCGKLIVSGSWDTTIRIWNNSDGSLIRTIKGHDDKITSIDFADEKHYIISAGNDASVKMWDISNGRLLRDLRGHKDKVLCVRTAPGREIFASASADGVIKIWNTRTGACLKTLECSPSGIKTMVFSPDGKFICAGGVDAIVRIWNLESESCEREFKGHSRDVSAVDFSPNSRFVLSASVDGSILLWELDWELRLFD